MPDKQENTKNTETASASSEDNKDCMENEFLEGLISSLIEEGEDPESYLLDTTVQNLEDNSSKEVVVEKYKEIAKKYKDEAGEKSTDVATTPKEVDSKKEPIKKVNKPVSKTSSSNQKTDMANKQNTDFNKLKDDPKSSKKSLWVRGIAPYTTADDLKKHFSQYGKVVVAKIVTQTRRAKNNRFGYVTMSNEDEVVNSIQYLNKTTLRGSKIDVELFKMPANKKTLNAKKFKEEVNTVVKRKSIERKQPSKSPVRNRGEPRRKSLTTQIPVKEKIETTVKPTREEEREKREMEEFKRKKEELEREREKIKRERERLEREKMELMLTLEREKLEMEKAELQREIRQVAEARRIVKSPPRDRDRRNDVPNRKMSAEYRDHRLLGSKEPPSKYRNEHSKPMHNISKDRGGKMSKQSDYKKSSSEELKLSKGKHDLRDNLIKYRNELKREDPKMKRDRNIPPRRDNYSPRRDVPRRNSPPAPPRISTGGINQRLREPPRRYPRQVSPPVVEKPDYNRPRVYNRKDNNRDFPPTYNDRLAGGNQREYNNRPAMQSSNPSPSKDVLMYDILKQLEMAQSRRSNLEHQQPMSGGGGPLPLRAADVRPMQLPGSNFYQPPPINCWESRVAPRYNYGDSNVGNAGPAFYGGHHGGNEKNLRRSRSR